MIQPEDVPAILEELRPYFTTIVEVQLKDWGEGANPGPWVAFRLPEPEELEPFRGQDRSGRNARTGKRYTLMLIALTDQDEPERRMDDETPRPRKLSQIAGGLCHDPKFRAWCEFAYGEPCPDEEAAANLIREVCGVESRSFLDSNPDAAALFRELLSNYDEAKGHVPQS
jgi:hypothetical protein